MTKELSELTLEELWELFPIILKAHNEDYSGWYEEMKLDLLKCIDKSNCARINHIGSTAVKGLLSKPTIDILLELDGLSNIDEIVGKLVNDGWILMHSEIKPNLNYVFNKGYTKYGFADKVYHLHMVIDTSRILLSVIKNDERK
ncbi:hypothetical protein JCM19376_34250 [Fusibacter bizertensis]